MDIKYLGIWSGKQVLNCDSGNEPFWKMELQYKVYEVKSGENEKQISIPLNSSWTIDEYLKNNPF